MANALGATDPDAMDGRHSPATDEGRRERREPRRGQHLLHGFDGEEHSPTGFCQAMLVAHMVSVHVKAMRCAHQLVRMLKEASADDRRRASDYDDLLKALFAVHPVAMLDEMFTGDAKSVTTGCRFIEALARRRASPLDGVPPDTDAWCKFDPAARYPVAAASGVLFRKDNETAPLQWTPLASLLLKNAPDAKEMLSLIAKRFYFNGWSGSWTTKMEGRLKLLKQLHVGSDVELQKAKAEALASTRSQIEESRRREAEEDRQSSARFE